MPSYLNDKDNPEDSQELRALKLSLGVYVFVFALKLIVYLVTGVMALLARRCTR